MNAFTLKVSEWSVCMKVMALIQMPFLLQLIYHHVKALESCRRKYCVFFIYYVQIQEQLQKQLERADLCQAASRRWSRSPPKFNHLFLVSDWTFHEMSSQTDKQTNSPENIASLAEVIIVNECVFLLPFELYPI